MDGWRAVFWGVAAYLLSWVFRDVLPGRPAPWPWQDGWMSQPIPPDDPTPRRSQAVVALVLLLLGATMVTVGVSLIVSVPAGVIVLGALLITGGLLLGLSSS